MKPFRQKITLATELGVNRDLWSHLSYGWMISSCEERLKRLKTEYVDLYVVHFNDPETSVEETVVALEDLVKEGKILSFGLGHLPVEKVEEYCKLHPPSFLYIELNVAMIRAIKEQGSLLLTHKI